MLIEYRTYRNKKLSYGADIVIRNRLYTPGADGIRNRAIDYEDSLQAIVIAYHNGFAIGCITLDKGYVKRKKVYYGIVNTWIKPSYRRKGIAAELIRKTRKLCCFDIAGYASKDGQFFYSDMKMPCIKYWYTICL